MAIPGARSNSQFDRALGDAPRRGARATSFALSHGLGREHRARRIRVAPFPSERPHLLMRRASQWAAGAGSDHCSCGAPSCGAGCAAAMDGEARAARSRLEGPKSPCIARRCPAAARIAIRQRRACRQLRIGRPAARQVRVNGSHAVQTGGLRFHAPLESAIRHTHRLGQFNLHEGRALIKFFRSEGLNQASQSLTASSLLSFWESTGLVVVSISDGSSRSHSYASGNTAALSTMSRCSTSHSSKVVGLRPMVRSTKSLRAQTTSLSCSYCI